MLGIRKGNWKLIPRANGKAELYDLAKDSGEKHNVAAENAAAVSELRDLLDKARRM
jgi:arylsulfatase A-like enzyme